MMFGLSPSTLILIIGGIASVLAVVLPRVKLPAIKLPSWNKQTGPLSFTQRITHFDSLYCDLQCRGEFSAAQAMRDSVLPALVDKRGEAN